MRRILLLSLLPALVLLVAPGCPLDIRVRCDEPGDCLQGFTCVRGDCEPATPTDGGCTGEECEVPDGGCIGLACEVPDAGCTGTGCETPDAGCTGSGCGTPDAGCASTVPVGGTCARPCECADAAAACRNGTCTLTCTSDFTCPDGQRCMDSYCEVGLRLGEPCRTPFECPGTAQCPRERLRCEAICNPRADLCAEGYQCAPDALCVRECSGAPDSVGEECENSMDCSPCSVCLTSGAALRCRQPCRLDRDCPGGATGACEQVGDTKACRL